MTFDLKYGSLHDAIEGAFSIDVGKNVYVSFGTDGLWHVTDWNSKAKDTIYICFPTPSENDPIWLESTL
jgi:hypothetical protein